MALTPKQSMFVKEYQIDRNATQAAIRAGYSKKTANEQGCRLLANVSVASEVDKQTQKIAARVDITAEDVLQSIKDIRAECRTDQRHGDALRANELLGKHLKLFVDKIEIEDKTKVKSDDELDARIAELEARVSRTTRREG